MGRSPFFSREVRAIYATGRRGYGRIIWEGQHASIIYLQAIILPLTISTNATNILLQRAAGFPDRREDGEVINGKAEKD